MLRAKGVCIAAVVLVCACAEWVAPRPGLTEQDQLLLSTMVLSGTPVDPTNEFLADDAVAELGQQLFFDKGLSNVVTDGGFVLASDGVACSECHQPTSAFSDDRGARNVSRGLGWTARNSPGLLNVGFYEWWGWDGRADTLWGQSANAYESAATMGGTPLRLGRAVLARYADRYQAVFKQPLPDFNGPRFDAPLSADATMELNRVYQRLLKAWAGYQSRLVSADAPFDRYARGDDHALSDPQRRGLSLFIGKAGCIECHKGPMFSDNRFSSVGVGQVGVNVAAEDKGRESGLERLAALPHRRTTQVPAPTAADLGQFRTKSLRSVSETAPYMHAGQLASLRDVVWFYDRGGDHAGAGVTSRFMVPLGLSDSEQRDLVAFLESLTGAPPPSRWLCNNARPASLTEKRTNPCAVTP